MTLDGRVNVDVLFHDKNGTSSIKVVSLNNSVEYPDGKVAVITGTAGTSFKLLGAIGQTTYRNAAGEAVLMDSVERIVFIWSGDSPRTLANYGEAANFQLLSARGIPAVTFFPSEIPDNVELGGGAGTGTYKIILCETFNP
jgi:hypothetical protein